MLFFLIKANSTSMPDPTKFGFRRRSNPFVLQGIKQVEPVVWILDSGSSRHMTGDRALLSNVVEKAENIKVKNVVLPDKGQFYKYVGPNQVWVPKKV